MKKFILIATFILIAVVTKAQKYFIQPLEDGAEKTLVDALLKKGKSITFNQDSAKYILKIHVKRMTGERAKGGIMLIDRISGELLGQTKEVIAGSAMVNGWDNPVSAVLNKVCKKYLDDLLPKM